MLRLLLLLAFAAFCLCANPIYQAKHYQVFKLEDRHPDRKHPSEPREFQEGSGAALRTVVEQPYNGSVPFDDGSALFGDIEFSTTRKDGELVIRDTIVNHDFNGFNVSVFYNRSLPGYYVEDFRIYNVGRLRGFGAVAAISHNAGYVEAQLLISAHRTVRIFAEIFVRP